MDVSRGSALVLLGVGLVVATMAVGAATAPDRSVGGVDASTPTPTPADGTATPDGSDGETPTEAPLPESPRTLVGVQGGWVTHGSVLGYDGGSVEWRNTQADGYFEVTRLDNGTVLAAFANESSEECGDIPAPCARTGYRIIEPGSGEIRSEYSFPVREITNREVHAADPTGNGGIVFTDMDEERIAIVENGTVVWEWHASSFYEAPEDPTSRDWLHINDVDTIGDGRFLVSVRNANQILVVERGEGVVEVVNEDTGTSDANCLTDTRLYDADGDGDVRCGDPSVIKEQHNPQWLGNGAVLVADSENDRVVELHRTENGSWEPAWIVDGLHWPRDADRLPNGNTLITDSLGKRVIEVNPEGKVVWSVATDDDVTSGPGIPYEADRLPYGEFAGSYDDGNETPSDGNGTVGPTKTPLPRMNGSGSLGGPTGGGIPLLSLAVAGIQGSVAQVPFWFRETHLAVSVLGLVLVLVGGVDHLRATRDRPLIGGE
ncbi:arylsulfotransferase family protein [Halosimplex aquaticum]|uniref:Arylsulfotransferase family protein n=1 Tax=Halosimplex aquaticum TaxID=3026162 RepID=A0ABD5Y197_9EURY|nr:arylsulfotransferase family protein [Halosimplex aquaticum]